MGYGRWNEICLFEKNKINGFVFCTDSYTLEEVKLLVKVLQNKLGLNCGSKLRKKDVYRLYIYLFFWKGKGKIL